MLTAFGLLAKAQRSADTPLEGGSYVYACNGISEGADYTFFVTANADGTGVYDDDLTWEFDFIGNTTGVIADDGLATTQILWNEGASLNNYYVWLEVSILGCSNSIRLEVAPQLNNRVAEFESTASTDCFNKEGNSFSERIITLDNNGQPIGAAYFPLNVEFSVNGVSYSQKLQYDDQSIQVDEDWFSPDPTVDNDVLVAITSITDKDGIPIKSGTSATYTHTIFALPIIEFSEELRKKYLIDEGAFAHIVTYNPDGIGQSWTNRISTGTE
ncbi:hypothetical protein [Draconibacterium sp.]|uniref:hypothetical protein n=1 Tax=Draconibacterium sp. TaxID=1965318 RepID=UPI0035677216